MYICICNAVSENQLREAYAKTGCWEQAAIECGAGQNCGTCIQDIENFFEREGVIELPMLAA